MTDVSNGVRSVKLAVLVNDTPVQQVQDEFGDYARIYKWWLSESRPSDDITFDLDAFYVFEDSVVYPDAGKYDAIILTGSGEHVSRLAVFILHSYLLFQLHLHTLHCHG